VSIYHVPEPAQVHLAWSFGWQEQQTSVLLVLFKNYCWQKSATKGCTFFLAYAFGVARCQLRQSLLSFKINEIAPLVVNAQSNAEIKVRTESRIGQSMNNYSRNGPIYLRSVNTQRPDFWRRRETSLKICLRHKFFCFSFFFCIMTACMCCEYTHTA